jgi:hypothetical protein
MNYLRKWNGENDLAKDIGMRDTARYMRHRKQKYDWIYETTNRGR